MRRRIFVSVALAAIAALSFSMVAQSAEGDKVTGGGQILADNQDSGAGSTIAFVAMEKGGAARGQVQYVSRSGGTGQGQRVYHGVVSCLIVEHAAEGGAARLGGTWVRGPEDGEATDFEIFVEDNGEPNQGSDMIFVNAQSTEPNCADVEEDDDEPVGLARGNVQVHKAKNGD